MLIRLAHVCIETVNLEASAAFYEMLGAQQRFEFRNPDQLLIGMYLYFGEDSYIELVLVKEPRREGTINHFALQVTDVESVRALLLKNGVKVSERQLGVDKTWMISCRDPDDVYIEFHQYTVDSLQHQGGSCCIDYTP